MGSSHLRMWVPPLWKPAENSAYFRAQTVALSLPYEGIPLTLVMDGKVERNNLPLCGKDEGWLFSQLKKLGYPDVRKVLLCYLDTDGQMTVHGFGENPPARGSALKPEEVSW